MRATSALRFLGTAMALVLLAAGCTSEDGEEPPTPDGTPTATESRTQDTEEGPAVVSTSIVEPDSLLTLDSSEPGGRAVLGALYTGLITYDPQTAEPAPGVADSIESPDGGQTWQVVLEDGWTFHDGSAVTSEAFVDAWNHGAHQPNGLQNRGFFADIEGYDDLQCGTRPAAEAEVEAGDADEVGEDVPDCEEQPPDAEQLSGIEVVSDTEFTVTLSQPLSYWSQKVGYPAFSPLPESFFEDPEGFAEEPIGNGPFQMDEAWAPGEGLSVTAYDDYAGDTPAQVDGIEFRVHDDRDSALTALYEGTLDVLTNIPPERWAETQSQVPNTASAPGSSVNYLGFPTYDDTYADADLRAALSMAVDRELITETLFDGLRLPANNLLAPVVPGHEEQVCPEWTFRPEQARERFDEAGGLDGPLVVWLNEGEGHQPWLEAVVNQWSQHLDIDASQVEFEQRPFEPYLDVAAQQEMTGPFRLGWEMSYPHPQNYLQPLLDSRFQPPAGANNTGYGNDDFDARLDEALSTPDVEDAVPLYQEAVEIACVEVPLAPMFYGLHTVAWNEGIDDVTIDAFGTLDYTALTKP